MVQLNVEDELVAAKRRLRGSQLKWRLRRNVVPPAPLAGGGECLVKRSQGSGSA